MKKFAVKLCSNCGRSTPSPDIEIPVKHVVCRLDDRVIRPKNLDETCSEWRPIRR